MIARKFELPSLKNSEPVLHQNEIKSFQILGKVLSQCELFVFFSYCYYNEGKFNYDVVANKYHNCKKFYF